LNDANEDIKSAQEELNAQQKELEDMLEKMKDMEKKKGEFQQKLVDAKNKKKEAMDEYLEFVNNLSKTILKNIPQEETEENRPVIELYPEIDFKGEAIKIDLFRQGNRYTPKINIKSIKTRYARIQACIPTEQAEDGQVWIAEDVSNMAMRIPAGVFCCEQLKLIPLVEDTTAVRLYDKEGFEGYEIEFPDEGDYNIETKVESIKVLPGFRVRFFENVDQVGYLAEFSHDNYFLGSTLAEKQYLEKKTQDIKSIKVMKDNRVGAHLTFGNRTQFFSTEPGAYLVPDWMELDAINPGDAKVWVHMDDGTEWYATKENRVKPHGIPKTMYVDGVCSSGYCVNGRCIGIDECHCKGGYSGQRCTVQFPDSSSSIVCDTLATFLDEPIQCRFIPRKDNEGCTTHSMYVRIKPNDESLTMFDSPIAKENGWSGPPDYEADIFPFKVVGNITGDYGNWIDLSILHRAPSGYDTFFQPNILVRDLPQQWRIEEGNIIFGDEVPSSANFELRKKSGQFLQLRPHAAPVTTHFRILDSHIGEVCLSIRYAYGDIHSLGCAEMGEDEATPEEANRNATRNAFIERTRRKIDASKAWDLLRLGKWEDAFRAATDSRDPEMMVISSVTMGLVDTAKINARIANQTHINKFIFLDNCIEDKCPLDPLAHAYPAIP